MAKKQLIALYILYVVPFITGNAILPFLPIYVEQLGASPSITGYYLAISFGALATGTMVAGWLSHHYGRRKRLLVIAFMSSFLGLLWMAQTNSVFVLTIATSVVWFSGGIISTIVLILTGIFADENQRGTTFGILATASSLGAIIAGLYAGQILDLLDFQGLFVVTGFLFFIPMFALPLLEDAPHVKPKKSKVDEPKIPLGIVFWLLFFASVLLNGANFSNGMIRPILMNSLAFDSQAISSTVTVTGLGTILLPFAIGWLSDRIGRKPLLIVVYALVLMSLVVTMSAIDLWHFWLASVLGGMIITGFALGSALLTDIVRPEALDQALSRFASTQWFGGVLGYLLTGIALENLGINPTLIAGVMILIVAIVLLSMIQSSHTKQ